MEDYKTETAKEFDTLIENAPYREALIGDTQNKMVTAFFAGYIVKEDYELLLENLAYKIYKLDVKDYEDEVAAHHLREQQEAQRGYDNCMASDKWGIDTLRFKFFILYLWMTGWWDDGTMGRWDDGMMGWWDDGMMGWWDDGMMGRWDDGTMGWWDDGMNTLLGFGGTY